MLRLFPLLSIAVIAYNILAVGLGVTHYQAYNTLNSGVTIHIFSGDDWHYSIGDMLVTFALVLLFIEILKSTRTSSRQLINHGLSVLVFIVALVEFIALRGFATTTFFLIVVLCLIDVIAGYTISVVAAEHNLNLGRSGTD